MIFIYLQTLYIQCTHFIFHHFLKDPLKAMFVVVYVETLLTFSIASCEIAVVVDVAVDLVDA